MALIFVTFILDQFPTARRNYLARTLKDHLYECPSKISEELVRCMAAVYCWVRSDSSEKPEKGRSPFLSRSSTSVILPRRVTADGQQWSSRSTVEISSISLDKIQFLRASYAINNYRLEQKIYKLFSCAILSFKLFRTA